jgi:hypothetical protein
MVAFNRYAHRGFAQLASSVVQARARIARMSAATSTSRRLAPLRRCTEAKSGPSPTPP